MSIIVFTYFSINKGIMVLAYFHRLRNPGHSGNCGVGSVLHFCMELDPRYSVGFKKSHQRAEG